MVMPDAGFKADCASCSALCCVVPAFDIDQGFGYDKSAHIPCTNLQDDFRCNVHADLATCGFAGCVIYDCHGAGQWVTQVLFNGANWRDSPEMANAMFAAFARQSVLHELMLLLTTAMRYNTEAGQQKLLGAQLHKLEQLSLPGADIADEAAIVRLKESTKLLLQSFRQTPAFTALKSRRSQPGKKEIETGESGG